MRWAEASTRSRGEISRFLNRATVSTADIRQSSSAIECLPYFCAKTVQINFARLRGEQRPGFTPPGHLKFARCPRWCATSTRSGESGPEAPSDTLDPRRTISERRIDAGLPQIGRFEHVRVRRENQGQHPYLLPQPPQNCFVASLAPSAIAASLAHTTSGSTAAWPTQVPKPQSLPTMTLSRPTRLA